MMRSCGETVTVCSRSLMATTVFSSQPEKKGTWLKALVKGTLVKVPS